MTFMYQNPIFDHDFADPFVLRASDAYYAYGTAAAGDDGRIFPILRSTDLVQWTRLAGALAPLQNPPARSYWAPEVIEYAEQYYLFYSASTGDSDETHRLRVAIASSPAGPFNDTGRLLLPDLGFSIDASPFRDPQTGRHYLYFASDFESDEPMGTGISVVELADNLLSTMSKPRTVVRALAEWQIYERNRQYKGRLWEKWHCVEGPSVVYHEGKYYCFYSGGAWHGTAYGVGFAVAEHPLGPWTDTFAEQGAVVLRGIPDKVIGPGHNSTVLAPDDQTLLMIYHAWDPAHTKRRMCLDPIRWTADGPRVDGPSTEPRTIDFI